MPKSDIITIDAEAGRLTLINIYEVEAGQQAALTQALLAATREVIRHQPGFVSVSIHGSLDGQKVVNYAQWASKAVFEAFMKKPETQAQLKTFAGLAKSVAPGLYSVEAVVTT